MGQVSHIRIDCERFAADGRSGERREPEKADEGGSQQLRVSAPQASTGAHVPQCRTDDSIAHSIGAMVPALSTFDA